MGVRAVAPDSHEKTRPFVRHTLYTRKTNTHNMDRLFKESFTVSVNYQSPKLTVPPFSMDTRHEVGLTEVRCYVLSWLALSARSTRRLVDG